MPDENYIMKRQLDELREEITALKIQVAELKQRVEHVIAGIGFMDHDVTEIKKRLSQTWSPRS